MFLYVVYIFFLLYLVILHLLLCLCMVAWFEMHSELRRAFWESYVSTIDKKCRHGLHGYCFMHTETWHYTARVVCINFLDICMHVLSMFSLTPKDHVHLQRIVMFELCLIFSACWCLGMYKPDERGVVLLVQQHTEWFQKQEAAVCLRPWGGVNQAMLVGRFSTRLYTPW